MQRLSQEPLIHTVVFAGGFSPIILNLSMIATLFYFGVWQNRSLEELAIFLSFSILIAGTLQFILPAEELRRKFQWKCRLDLKGSEELSRMNQIFWIGALGAAVIQVNILVSRFLAFSLDENGSCLSLPKCKVDRVTTWGICNFYLNCNVSRTVEGIIFT